jgi:hypothetical protein
MFRVTRTPAPPRKKHYIYIYIISKIARNRCSYKHFCLEWPILWLPRILIFPPGTPCISYGCMFCVLLFNFVNYVFYYFHVSWFLCLSYFIVVCIVCASMCTALLPPGVNPMSVNEIHHISYGHIGESIWFTRVSKSKPELIHADIGSLWPTFSCNCSFPSVYVTLHSNMFSVLIISY